MLGVDARRVPWQVERVKGNNMKRRIKRNIWGNWYGYEGTRRVIEFGEDERDAKEWLETGVDPHIARMPQRTASGAIKLAWRPD